ncbi:PREDICTED: uncharacterized protein C4orf22 homolog [Tinamus guttatus]|uniref:uncharacterized protein C4orf22 homolog n=1 Tax=Tinamus guttatus TaxID=94827 RepID=UPI00052EBC45|nr:PREDICTED: uncharacterized protein C4orf22 homolog [Tinamus guttatus]
MRVVPLPCCPYLASQTHKLFKRRCSGHRDDQHFKMVGSIAKVFWLFAATMLRSIIFIRDRNSRRQEVSAYIDYAHRLTTDDFEAYFSGKKRLFPRSTDLSFYNWDRNVSTSNSSPNYQVIAENACGLLFKNKSDRKIINVDPKTYPGDNTTRTPIETDLYLHVVIYDHILRRGA